MRENNNANDEKSLRCDNVYSVTFREQIGIGENSIVVKEQDLSFMQEFCSGIKKAEFIGVLYAREK